MSKNTDNLTFVELVNSGNEHAIFLYNLIRDAISVARTLNRNPLEISEFHINKDETKFTEYQNEESIVIKNWKYDRQHNLDRVIINDFNQKNNANLETVKIIYGPAANEYTRSNHALALAVADIIYFRNGAYKPESEEGRALLMHELTHVNQNKNKDELRNTEKNKLETEAEEKENQEKYNPDPDFTIKYKGKYITMRKSQVKQFANDVAEKILEKVENNVKQMNEEEILNYLVEFMQKIKTGETSWLQ